MLVSDFLSSNLSYKLLVVQFKFSLYYVLTLAELLAIEYLREFLSLDKCFPG